MRKAKRRTDLKIKKWIDALGATMALLGMGGMAGAAEGEGDLVIAIGVFVIGFAIVLWGYQK